MKTTILALVLALLGGSLYADVIAKGSATDKAVGKAINLGTDMTARAVSATSKALEEVVSSSVALLKSGKDFVADQFPKVVTEFMHWRLAQCAFWIGIALVLILIAQIAGYKFQKKHEEVVKSKAYNDGGWRFGAVVCRYVLTSIFILALIGPNVYEAVYITVAPRIYLIENMVHLIKWGNLNP